MDLKIVSYNVFYQAIEHQIYLDRFNNDIKTIEKDGKIDILGLQESVNAAQMIANCDSLNEKKVISCWGSAGGLSVTFLNPAFEILSISYGSFIYQRRKGRPFTIINCRLQNTDFLIINCHFHHLNKSDLQAVVYEMLSNRLSFGYLVPDTEIIPRKIFHFDTFHNELAKNTKFENLADLFVDPKTKKTKDFHVIMLGDFNDCNRLKLYEGIKPFRTEKYNPHYKNKDLDKIILGTRGRKPPKTCCLNKKNSDVYLINTELEGDFHKIGDYILVNDKFKILRNNYVPITKKDKPEESTSDHLPCAMLVRFKPKDSSGKGQGQGKGKSVGQGQGKKGKSVGQRQGKKGKSVGQGKGKSKKKSQVNYKCQAKKFQMS